MWLLVFEREIQKTRASTRRFPSNPLIVRVTFFLLFNFTKETPKLKGQKGTTGVSRLVPPSLCHLLAGCWQGTHEWKRTWKLLDQAMGSSPTKP